jgi:hypothetical protein
MLRAINENSFNTFTMLLVKPRVSWFSTRSENKDVPNSGKKAHRGSGRKGSALRVPAGWGFQIS